MKAGFVVLALAGALLAGAPAAMACVTPTPRTPAEEAAYVSSAQASAWDRSVLVFVARIEQTRTKPRPSLPSLTEVDLMPVTWLKGQAGPWQFTLADIELSGCGFRVPGFDAIEGQVGEEFVIFVDGDTPMQRGTLMTVKVDKLVEPRALAALKAQN